MAAGASARSPEVRQALLEARRAEDDHVKLLARLQRQVARARRPEQSDLLTRTDTQAPPPSEFPMPRTGPWRCNRRATCEGCRVGTCKSDPDRQENSCNCHTGKKCKVWDQIGPCNTSYDEAPPSAKALRQLGRIQEEGSIASTATTVTCTANSLRQTCQGLTYAMAASEKKADALVVKVEEEEDTMDVTL